MQTTPTIEDALSDPVSQLFDVERRLSRIYSVVRTVTALASHENELPPTIYVTDALDLLEEQLKEAADGLQDAIDGVRQMLSVRGGEPIGLNDVGDGSEDGQ